MLYAVKTKNSKLKFDKHSHYLLLEINQYDSLNGNWFCVDTDRKDSSLQLKTEIESFATLFYKLISKSTNAD